MLGLIFEFAEHFCYCQGTWQEHLENIEWPLPWQSKKNCWRECHVLKKQTTQRPAVRNGGDIKSSTTRGLLATCTYNALVLNHQIVRLRENFQWNGFLKLIRPFGIIRLAALASSDLGSVLAFTAKLSTVCGTVFSIAESSCVHTVSFASAEKQLHAFPYECTRFNSEGAVFFQPHLVSWTIRPLTEDAIPQKASWRIACQGIAAISSRQWTWWWIVTVGWHVTLMHWQSLFFHSPFPSAG